MSVHINTKEFQRAWSAVAGCVNSRMVGTKPALGFVLLHATERQATLTATDLECAIRVQFPCDATEEMVLLLPAAKARPWVNLVRDESVKVTQKDVHAHLSAGRMKMLAESMPAVQFPPFTEAPDSLPVQGVTAGQLRAALSVKYACDVNSAKYQFGGVCVHSTPEGKLLAIGSDGVQCAIFSLGDSTLRDGMWIVPERAASLICSALPDEAAAECKLQFDQNRCYVTTPSSSIEARLLEGRFANYGVLREKAKPNASVSVSVKSLHDACRVAALATDVEDKYSRRYGTFTIENGDMTVESNDAGESSASIPIAYTGPKAQAVIDIACVGNFLRQCHGIDDVEFNITDGDGGIAILRAGPNFSTFIFQQG